MMASSEQYRGREFWIQENRQYAKPNFRLRKCARLLDRRSGGKPCELLDLGCGPAALRHLLPPNIQYRGVDIALHESAPYLRELNFTKDPIDYPHDSFDFVVALGVFEYVGQLQHAKFEEIRSILRDSGTFMMSYINFDHYRRRVWPAYNNMQPLSELLADLRTLFNVDQCFPVSHHWRHKQPGRFAAPGIQMHFNYTVPIISSLLAVEYLIICSPLTDYR